MFWDCHTPCTWKTTFVDFKYLNSTIGENPWKFSDLLFFYKYLAIILFWNQKNNTGHIDNWISKYSDYNYAYGKYPCRTEDDSSHIYTLSFYNQVFWFLVPLKKTHMQKFTKTAVPLRHFCPEFKIYCSWKKTQPRMEMHCLLDYSPERKIAEYML